MATSDRAAQEAETRGMLVVRYRSVAFAALRAGVSEDELRAGLQAALDAEDRRRAAIPAQRPPLYVVRDDEE